MKYGFWITLIIAAILAIWRMPSVKPQEPTGSPEDQITRNAVEPGVSESVLPQQEKQQAQATAPGGVLVFGRVVQKGTDLPVSGAEVSLFSPSKESIVQKTHTEKDGSFRLEGVPHGLYLTSTGGSSWYAKEEHRVHLKNDMSSLGPLKLEVERAVQLTVRVVDPDQNPISKAKLTSVAIHSLEKHTDKNGYAQVRIPTAFLSLTVEAPGFASARHLFSREDGHKGVKIIQLKRGHRLYGQVLDEDGSAFEDAKVTLIQGHPYTATTDQSGQYFFDGVAPGPFELEARVQDTLGYRAVHMRMNNKDKKVDITIQLRGEPTPVEGQVIGPNGPIAGARVWCSRNNGFEDSEVTDANGYYRIARPEYPDTILFLVSAKGHRDKIFYVTKRKSNPVNLELEPSPPLSVQIQSPQGDPLAGVTVTGKRNRLALPLALKTDDTGMLQIPMPVDHAVIKFSHPDYVERALSLPLEEVVTLFPKGVFQGQVIDEDTHDPIRDFKLVLTYSGGELKKSIKDDAGTFDLEGIGQGSKAELSIQAFGYTTYEETVTLPAAENQFRQTFKMQPNRMDIAGIVVDEQDRPVPEVEVILNNYLPNTMVPGTITTLDRPIALQRHREFTDINGRFSFSDVDGTHSLEVIAGSEFSTSKVGQLETLSPEARQQLKLILPTEAILNIKIDTDLWPESAWVNIRNIDTSRGASLPIERLEPISQPPGTYDVALVARREEVGAHSSTQPFGIVAVMEQRVTVRAGEVRDVFFTGPYYRLEGKALAAGQEPHASLIYLMSFESGAIYKARLHSGGHFLFPKLPKGKYALILQEGVEQLTNRLLSLWPNKHVIELDDDITDGLWQFERYASLGGRVLDDAGVVLTLSNSDSIPLLSTQVDFEGRFLFPYVPPGAGYQLSLWDGIYQKMWTTDLTMGTTPLDLGETYFYDRGSLHLNISPQYMGFLTLWFTDVKDDGAAILQSRNRYQLSNETRESYIEGLPEGPTLIKITCSDARWKPENSWVRLDIRENTYLDIRMKPQSSLYLANKGASAFAKISLSRDGYQKILLDSPIADELTRGFESESWFTSKKASITGLDPGPWLLTATDETGKQFQQIVTLTHLPLSMDIYFPN